MHLETLSANCESVLVWDQDQKTHSKISGFFSKKRLGLIFYKQSLVAQARVLCILRLCPQTAYRPLFETRIEKHIPKLWIHKTKKKRRADIKKSLWWPRPVRFTFGDSVPKLSIGPCFRFQTKIEKIFQSQCFFLSVGLIFKMSLVAKARVLCIWRLCPQTAYRPLFEIRMEKIFQTQR